MISPGTMSSNFTFNKNWLLLCISAFISVGHCVDLKQSTENAFNEGLKRVIEEIQQSNTELDLNSSRSLSFNAPHFHEFPCDRLSPSASKPKSVHQLRPGDIDVVAALGDSYTAGRAAGAKGLNSLLHDYRGLSYSIGGDGTFKSFQSLPNILREFNPDLYGFANSMGDYMSSEAGFNVAKSGATSPDLTFQTALLIQQMKNDPFVDFNNDWKLVTILIGGNDLCRSCYSYYNSRIYLKNIKSTLDMLKMSLPRTFVNLVELMPVEEARQLPRGFVCERLQNYYCQCGSFPKTEEDYQSLIEERKKFQQFTENLVSSGIYDTNDNFTVVLQPYYRNASVPTIPGTRDIDYSLFAVDCFHYSEKGQARAGIGLWNNMLQPVGYKTTDWSLTDKVLCPSEEQPFLTTNKNSRALSKGDSIQAYSWTQKNHVDGESSHEWVESKLAIKVIQATSDESTQSKTSSNLEADRQPSMEKGSSFSTAFPIIVAAAIAALCLGAAYGVVHYGRGLIGKAEKGPYQEII